MEKRKTLAEEKLELLNVKFASIFVAITSDMIHNDIDFDDIIADVSFTYTKGGIKVAKGGTQFEITLLPQDTH
jgi:hypothetical protein